MSKLSKHRRRKRKRAGRRKPHGPKRAPSPGTADWFIRQFNRMPREDFAAFLEMHRWRWHWVSADDIAAACWSLSCSGLDYQRVFTS